MRPAQHINHLISHASEPCLIDVIVLRFGCKPQSAKGQTHL